MLQSINFRKSALLVIDMQEHFRPMTDGIVTEVNKTIIMAKSKGIPVVYSQHGHKDLNLVPHPSALVRWWGPEGSIRYGSKSWRLLPELYRAEEDVLIDEKTSYDMFYKTRLRSLLEGWGTTSVIIAGVMTNLCCETTARSAMVQNYDVIFLSDGTATDTAAHHKATLNTIGYGFGCVVSSAELRKQLSSL